MFSFQKYGNQRQKISLLLYFKYIQTTLEATHISIASKQASLLPSIENNVRVVLQVPVTRKAPSKFLHLWILLFNCFVCRRTSFE